ncbi:MAG: LysR family transcriptional regulator [Ruminococcus sp.]|nr:LysR family transcriptional regulator [Ruminococcus sp.]
MDIRVLKYFLAVAREQSFSVAAERLYLSQPTLSRQLKELEDELGKPLLNRSSKGVTLTEEGMILRARAEEIVALVDKAENEVKQSGEQVTGMVYIGAGETYAIKLVADTAKNLSADYPDLQYSIYSADGSDVLEKLEKGLLDFGIVFQNVDTSKYHSVELPLKDRFGVLMRCDCPLAKKETISVSDLKGQPLIIPRQPNHNSMFLESLGLDESKADIAAQYNLVYNGSVMASEGMGYCICIDRLINVTGESNMCFKPFEPEISASCSFIWKRNAVFSKAAEKFLEQFINDIKAYK